MAVNLDLLKKAREIDKQLKISQPKEEKKRELLAIIQRAQEASLAAQKTERNPLLRFGAALQSGIKSIGEHLKEAVKSPQSTLMGVVEEAALKPTAYLTRGIAKLTGSEKLKKLAELEKEGLAEYEARTPSQKARKVGEFLSWMIPYSATEKAVSGLPVITKIAKKSPKLASAITEATSWISTNQLLYNPETDGSRAKQALEDLAAFGVLKGVGRLVRLAKGRLAVRVADEAVKPIENAMKRGEKVPLEEVEKAVNKAKKIVKAGTGKEPKELVKEEILKPIKPEIKPKAPELPIEAISKVKGIKTTPSGEKLLEKPSPLVLEFIDWFKKTKPQYIDKAKLSTFTDGEPYFFLPGVEKARITLSDFIKATKRIKPKAKKTAEVKIEGIPKELEPLAREARKYKSAEEFVTGIGKKLDALWAKVKNPPAGTKQSQWISEMESITNAIKKGREKYLITPELKKLVKKKKLTFIEEKALKQAEQRFFKSFYNQAVKGVKEVKLKIPEFKTYEEMEKWVKKRKKEIPNYWQTEEWREISKKYGGKLHPKWWKPSPPPSPTLGVMADILEAQRKSAISRGLWQKISGYPKKGDYVRVEWKGKTFEGKITGEKPVRFKTGYVAREITTKEGVKKWMPWTSSAKYEVRIKETKLPEFPEKPSKSVELNTSVVPGAKAISNFIDRDVVESIKGKISFFSKVKILIKNWLNPPSDKEIKEATQIFLRQMKADVQQFKDQLWNSMDKRLKWWDRVPEEIKLAFMDKIEKGTITTESFLEFGKDKARVLADIAKEYRERLDKIYNLQKEYGDKISYIENYFPHIWEKPDDARRFISSYIRKIGKPAFMKKRYYDFIKDGMEAGLRLKTTNPEELVIMREIGGYQYLKMKEFLDRMKEQGWLKFNKGLKRPPYGWKALDRNALKVYFPTEKGVVQAGEWIMPEPAANVVNKFLSPSLWSSPEWYGKVFRGFMRSKNAVVAIKLGLSTFHMIETTMSDLATNLTIALKKASRKDFGGFLKTLAKTPIGPIESMRAGRIIEAWEKGPKTEWEKQAVDLIKRAGGRPRMSDVWRIQAKKQWRKAIDEFKAGNPIGGAIRIIPEILEAIQKPVLDWYVPRLKVSNFLRVAEDYISAHPNISERELDKYLTKLWDSMDNRFGQLVYDNLFWQRWIRDLGVASSLSMGWNLGTIREFGGGALDFTKLAAKLATKQGKAEITDRMIYSITYPLVFGTLGGLITYISTGKPPQELLDYYYPKTGNKNPDGSDERLQMPTMMKEFFGSKSALQKYGPIKGTAIYAWHKTNPLISIVLDVFENKNFYGVEIRDKNAPAVKQAKQLAEYLGREALVPISISGYLRRKRVSGKSSITPFIGFVPAPRYVTETPIQSDIYTLYSKRFGGQVKTKEQWERAQVKAEIRTLYLQGKVKEANEKLKEAVKKGYIKQVKKFIEDSDLPSDIRAFRALPSEDQKGLIRKMKLEDLQKYVWYAHSDVKKKLPKTEAVSKFIELWKSGKIKKPKWKRQRLVK